MESTASHSNVQPVWHQSLPPHIQFVDGALVAALETLRNELKLDDQAFMMFVVQSKTVMVRNLRGAYQDARLKDPNASDRDHFAMVTGARLMRKIEVHGVNNSPCALPQATLRNFLMDLRNIVSRFSSFEDVVQFFIALETREKRFDDKAGHIARIDECCGKFEST